MMTTMLGAAEEAVTETSRRTTAPRSRMVTADRRMSRFREEARQRRDLAPAFALFDLLDAKVMEIIV